MQNAFDYAGCDANGNNCTGPRRVKAFKDKANQFFDPYENVLDEVYDALIMAQSLGVDITDIYMMLNGSCNVWGKYLCGTCSAAETGKLLGDKDKEGEYRCEEQSGNYYYTVAKVLNKADNTWKVAPNQRHCTLTQMLSSRDDVQQNWLDMGAGSSGGIRVECASDAIESSTLFRNRKKQASIDIETLQRMILQDAPNTFKGKANDPQSGDLPAPTGYCSVDDNDIAILNNLTQKRALTSSGLSKVCVSLKSKTGFLDPVMISASESKNDSNTGAEFDSTPYDGKPLCEAQAKLSGGTCKELTGIWYIFGGNSSDRYTTIDNCKRNLAENHECVTAAPGFRQVQTIYSNSCSSYCTSWEQVGDKSKEECLKKCADEEKSKTANTSNTTKPITLTFDMLGQGTEQRISNIKNSDTKTNNPIQNASISFKQTNCISYGGTWLGTHCDCTRVEPGSFIMCTNATR